MKIEIDDLDEIFDSCKRTGRFREKQIDLELIRSLKQVSEKSLHFIDSRIESIQENSTDWTFVFRDYYEALRMLIEAYLLFEGIEADSHQGKNAYICKMHPELEMDWSFLETVRLKRNAINYRGQLLQNGDWAKMKLNFALHISVLSSELEKKIGLRKL